jgi:ketosteroid isomerase-like protein
MGICQRLHGQASVGLGRSHAVIDRPVQSTGGIFPMTIQHICALSSLCLILSLGPFTASHVDAKTQLTPATIQEVEQTTVDELLKTFQLAEEALQAQDLDGIMALYADEYAYHGLKKADIKNIWRQLFDHYTELESVHSFSMIRRVGPASKLTAEMTCTGVVWGTSKQTSLRAPIDSWYEEIHYLRKDNGRWKIVGHAGGESKPVLQFGVAPHPLF